MLTSIFDNQGFWIGRYEAGMLNEESRTSTDESIEGLVAFSQPNLIPINNVTPAQAQTLAKKVSNGDNTSSLLFGIQWDLTLKYIEEKTVAKAPESEKNSVRNQIRNEITSNSTSWGNYSNSEFILKSGKYNTYKNGVLSLWKSYETEDNEFVDVNHKKLVKNPGSGIMVTTGAYVRCNIYDLAGNLSEFTLESDGNGTAFSRGGLFFFPGNIMNVSAKLSPARGDAITGFRVAIY